MELVPIRCVSSSFQSKDVSGAQYSLFLFCVAFRRRRPGARAGRQRARGCSESRAGGRAARVRTFESRIASCTLTPSSLMGQILR